LIKIPNRFGKKFRKPQGGISLLTLYKRTRDVIVVSQPLSSGTYRPKTISRVVARSVCDTADCFRQASHRLCSWNAAAFIQFRPLLMLLWLAAVMPIRHTHASHYRHSSRTRSLRRIFF